MLLLERISTIIRLVLVYIMSSEWTNDNIYIIILTNNGNNSLGLTIMILIIFLYTLYHLWILSVSFSISILTQLQDCREPWFSSNPYFSEKMHTERRLEGSIVALKSRRIDMRGCIAVHDNQNLYIRFYTWRANVTCEVASTFV